jgi:WD40 repeat protein
MKILQVKDKKTESFMFLCKENVKITINTNVEPISVNSSNFPYNGINHILEHNQQYLLACYSPNIIVLNSQTLVKETEIVDSECNEIYNVAIWNNFLITLGNDKMIKFWDINV